MSEERCQYVRERFLSMGLQNFPPHNVLELLLSHTIPKRDTCKIARFLLDQFGSLTDVLDASVEELCQVPGVGENSALLIHLVVQLAKRYYSEQGNEKISFDSTESFRRFVLSQFIGIKTEVAFLLCLNSATQLLRCCKVSIGTQYSVSLDSRTLLETAFRQNATKVILAHNHPNGIATPSQNDINYTENATRLFRDVRIQLLDHLIVADSDCFSMASHPKYARIFLKKFQTSQ